MAQRLLIVDDSEVFRRAASVTLSAEGYDVVGVAEDGRSGLTMAECLAPDLVILDISLPDMEGFDVSSRLTALDHPPVVVLVSSREWVDVRQRVADCGAIGFVPKEMLSRDSLLELVGGGE